MAGLTEHAVSHLVRRGLKACGGSNPMSDDARMAAFKNLRENYQMPVWGIAIIAATGVIFFILMASVRYTIGDVIATLMMVETPAPQVVVERTVVVEEPDAPLEKMEKEPLLDTESVTITPKLITRSARSTMFHLTREAGWTSRWRGMGFEMIYASLSNLFYKIMTALSGFPNPLWSLLSSMLFVRFHMAWTHSMIVHPESIKGKKWHQRLPSRQDAKKVAFPMFVFALSQQLTLLAPVGAFFLMGMQDGIDVQNDKVLGVKIGLMILAPIVVAIGLLLPALVTLIRMEASLLPEEYDTIVPFDRNFAGKVIPETKRAAFSSYVEAWRSFAISGRLRLLKLYTQLGLMQIVMVISLAAIVFCEVALIMGHDFDVMMNGIAAHLRQLQNQN